MELVADYAKDPEGVWKEVVAKPGVPSDGAVEVMAEMMLRVQRNLERIIDRLLEEGYQAVGFLEVDADELDLVDAIEEIGGFPQLPFMEDLELALRCRNLGRWLYLDKPVRIDARHWRKGVISTTLRNWSLGHVNNKIAPDRENGIASITISVSTKDSRCMNNIIKIRNTVSGTRIFSLALARSKYLNWPAQSIR